MEHTRYDLDAQMASLKRAPIDARWSPRKRKIVAAACALSAGGALAGGADAAWYHAPPGMPRTAQEAVAVLESGRFERMDASRRQQYAEEAGRLLRDLPDEQRRALFQDEETREALRALWEERMAYIVRRFARGEEIERPGAPGPGGPRAQGPRPDFQNLTDEERAAMRERMRAEARNRMNEQFSSGNAQTGGLQGEMFKRMAAQGGFGGRGPGGPGGAGGPAGSGPRGGGG